MNKIIDQIAGLSLDEEYESDVINQLNQILKISLKKEADLNKTKNLFSQFIQSLQQDHRMSDHNVVF
jgi:hypothetical protein